MFEWFKKLFNQKSKSTIEETKEVKIIETRYPIQWVQAKVIIDMNTVLKVGETTAKELLMEELQNKIIDCLSDMITYDLEEDKINGRYILRGEIGFVKGNNNETLA